MKPKILAQLDERPRIAVLPDGTLWGLYVSREVGVQEVLARPSVDGGNNWGEPEALFALPEAIAPEEVAAPPLRPGGESIGGSAPVGEEDDTSDGDPIGRWGGCEVVVDAEGEVHLFLMNDRGTGVLRRPDIGEVRKSLGAHQRRLDIWHARSEGGRERWRLPRRIWKGYTGSINSVIQTSRGRIILSFALLVHRTWADRGEGLDAFHFVGTSSSTVVYSDDRGDSWHLSPSALKVRTPSIGTYGAVEPVSLELSDGRVWMLARTQVGRLYESFSENGEIWSPLRPTRLLSSDSPVGLVRLPDGRIVLLWNKCQRFPYAHGGRHVLHAAISEDEGKTWIGQREVARDPLREEPPPPGGDHGTAYPYPAVMPDGQVLVTTGQGAGRVVVMAIDPEWLYEKRQESDCSQGMEGWESFGCRGVELKETAGGKVLSVMRVDEERPATAVWNFPSGSSGRLAMRLCLEEGSDGACVLLSDHFSVPFDPEDALNALFRLEVGSGGEIVGGGRLNPGKWHDLELRWDFDVRDCRVIRDGQEVAVLPLLRESEGACYLRLKAVGEKTESGGLLVDRVEVEVG